MDKLWLPEGKHWGLTIEHRQLEDAGSFTGGGRKNIWHTTEGRGIDGAYATLKGNRDASHVIIDPSNGHVIQTIPFDRAARALAHPSGPETNRARCYQIEITGFALASGSWSNAYYTRLAALAVLMEHRTKVLRKVGASFAVPHRMTGAQFVRATGHLGHVHVPGNNHTDPGTGFRIHDLLSLMTTVEKRY